MVYTWYYYTVNVIYDYMFFTALKVIVLAIKMPVKTLAEQTQIWVTDEQKNNSYNLTL